MQLIFEQCLAQGLLDLAVARDGFLPARKAHDAHDFINIVHDTFNHHRSITVARFIEEFGQGGFALVLFLEGIDLSTWLQTKGPLPVGQAVEFGEEPRDQPSGGLVGNLQRPGDLGRDLTDLER